MPVVQELLISISSNLVDEGWPSPLPFKHFSAKMGTIKDSMDLTEAEDVKKRWQEYTEEVYKKDLHDPDNHDDVITHLEPDILECEVKWTLRQSKPWDATLKTG